MSTYINNSKFSFSERAYIAVQMAKAISSAREELRRCLTTNGDHWFKVKLSNGMERARKALFHIQSELEEDFCRYTAGDSELGRQVLLSPGDIAKAETVLASRHPNGPTVKFNKV